MWQRWVLTLQSGEVELHKQPSLFVGVPPADVDDDRVTVADVNSSSCGDPSSTRTHRSSLCSTTSIVNGNRDGEIVIQSGNGNLGAIFSAELHGCHLGRDGVVCHVVEGEGVRVHLVRKRNEGGWRKMTSVEMRPKQRRLKDFKYKTTFLSLCVLIRDFGTNSCRAASFFDRDLKRHFKRTFFVLQRNFHLLSVKVGFINLIKILEVFHPCLSAAECCTESPIFSV